MKLRTAGKLPLHVLILLAVALPGTGTALESSAFIQSLSGTCMLSRGETVETVTLGMPLAQGDIVTCTEGGEATVVYNNDCAVQMPAESQLPIGAGDEPCEVLAAALIIPGAAAASVLAGNTGLIVLGSLGAAAAVGGILFAVSNSGGDDTGPISPQ
ncbi:MAG: hypothetical protein U9R74_18350 [Pseudomonadota bacterium]|nr:hypothetical protein [Pseudomonadota bacterium]